MPLSAETRRILAAGLANRRAAKELADAVDVGGTPAAAVAALGATSNLPTSNISTPGGNTAGDIKTAVDGGVNTLRAAVETRLDAAEGKVDAVIAALKAAGLMLP